MSFEITGSKSGILSWLRSGVIILLKEYSMSKEGGKELMLRKGDHIGRCGDGGRMIYSVKKVV